MATSSDESEDENFVLLGTPVPELDEGLQQKKPTTIQDLTAKDKHGRRRFHGAFTGGFSAGYFNTVGTKEGFTPSTFISSRQQRYDTSQARPEDFMDEEDLGEHGIAPRKFATVGSFTSEERKRKRHEDITQMTSSSSLNIGASLSDIIIPEQLPIGMKLLHKMGWREGQGLGPRVKKSKKKKQKKISPKDPSVKVYGCAMPPSDESDSDEFVPENLSDITFAPKDVTPISLEAKDNVHGLGYRGLDPSLALPGSHINLFDAPPVRSKSGGKGIRGQAFGVGAFEDEDEDIYAMDNMSNYDITMQLDDERDDKFGWTAPRKHGKQVVPVSYVGKLLEGFTLSSKPLKPKKKFSPPVLPRHFKPQHWFRKRRETSHLPEELTREETGSSQATKLTAVSRGLMLGETPLMGSVFDLVPEGDKNRIEATKQAIAMTQSLSNKFGAGLTSKFQPEQDQTSSTAKESLAVSEKPKELNNLRDQFLSKFKPADITPVQSSEASQTESKVTGQTEKAPLFQGSMSFQPFRKDPAKQARYDKYLLALKQGVSDAYAGVASSHMTEWERSRERDEFSKAAKIFRPMSAMMSSRFVGGAMIDDNKVEVPLDSENEKSDQAKAADMKMFGKLTREEFEWHPDKLLCRRFNVPNPYPGSDLVGLPTVKRDKYSIFNFLNFGDYQSGEIQESTPSIEAQETEPKERTLKPNQHKKPTMASVFKVLDDPDFHKPSPAPSDHKAASETGPKPTEPDEEKVPDVEETAEEPDMDLFRAIFKNSDSESSSNESEDEKKEKSSSEDEEGKSAAKVESDEDVQYTKRHENEGKQLYTAGKKLNVETVLGSSPAEKTLPSSTSQRSTNEQSSSRRLKSRWGQKSVFSVLENLDNEDESKSVGTEETASRLTPQIIQDESKDTEEYGPMPPPPSTSVAMLTAFSSGDAPTAKTSSHSSSKRTHRKEKRRRETSNSRHKHKKEKKKKSKHKKEKKHKKHRKSRRDEESSGSEADTESGSESSDVSDDELLKKLKQVSGSDKALKVLRNL